MKLPIWDLTMKQENGIGHSDTDRCTKLGSKRNLFFTKSCLKHVKGTFRDLLTLTSLFPTHAEFFLHIWKDCPHTNLYSW